MCHDVATLEHCKTIAPRCQAKPRCYENPRIRYFDQISARPNRAPYPRIRSCNSVKRLNVSSNSHIWMEHMQKVTNINHVKFDIHTLDNMEVTRTFMFNLHIQTILAKIMWDKLAECTASTIDQFFTWKPTFFGPNPTSPPPLPPCNVARKERLADESANIASGGEGGSERILQQFGKKALCPTHFGQDCLYHALSLQTPITRSVWNALSPNLWVFTQERILFSFHYTVHWLRGVGVTTYGISCFVIG